MKVLFIHHGRVMGGAPISLRNTLLGLKAYPEISVKVLCVCDAMRTFFKESAQVEVGSVFLPFQLIGRLMIGYASIFRLRTLKGAVLELLLLPITVFRHLRQFKKEAPDIIHLNSSILLAPAIAARLAGIPLVWHVREMIKGGKWNIRKMFAGFVIRNLANRVIAISPAEAAGLGKDTCSKVSVVYNFIDLERFRTYELPKDANVVPQWYNDIPADRSIFISLGGVSFRKGTVELMEAARRSPDGVLFLVAGPPPTSKTVSAVRAKYLSMCFSLEDLLCRLKLKKYYSWYYAHRVSFTLQTAPDLPIRFVGVLDDVRLLIAVSKALIFAGTTPHFPRPVYEAWAMKKPVIVFDMPGVTDNVENGIDGIVVKARSGRAIASAVQSILNDGQAQKRLGEYGYAKTKERFDMNKNIVKIVGVYKDLLASCAGANT